MLRRDEEGGKVGAELEIWKRGRWRKAVSGDEAELITAIGIQTGS